MKQVCSRRFTETQVKHMRVGGGGRGGGGGEVQREAGAANRTKTRKGSCERVKWLQFHHGSVKQPQFIIKNNDKDLNQSCNLSNSENIFSAFCAASAPFHLQSTSRGDFLFTPP